LEKKIQALETQLALYVQRESELESQLFILQQSKKKESKNALDRINKHIHQFVFQSKQTDFVKKDSYNILFDESNQDSGGLNDIFTLDQLEDDCSVLMTDNEPKAFFLPRLISMVQDFVQSNDKPIHEFCMDLNSALDQLEKQWADCQEEKVEYETTLDMMRREMETILDELEDTKQQRLRYKTQVTRMREALQKRTSFEEDEEKEAMRLLYNEAERQSADLDRECKRQSLALSSLRNEIKSVEAKYQTLKLEKNKQLIQLEHHIGQLALKNKEPCDGVQMALRASKADASLLRTRIYQLEKQVSVTSHLFYDINQLQFVLQSKSNQANDYQMKANQIEMEQRLWKQEQCKLLRKQHDIDLLNMHRDMRNLASYLCELEDEIEQLKLTHKHELAFFQFQTTIDYERKVQRLYLAQQLKERELEHQMDVLFQKNQTLRDESLVLYGRNLLLVDQLGKI
ncbi:uncharacterized protein B0P05DRAFT_456469, partial [Gilbertella persicaria]|uniref:uncharacterized protein n=1 Tax=Gilbertella persicaria TaxID=101096 RepID=UPI00221F50A1